MENVRRSKISVVPARKIHLSNILPRGDLCYEVLRSVDRDGVQQPLIVRPLKENPEEYEIIDGASRLWVLREDQHVPVEIRYGLKDSEVFRIREATFKRRQRTTCEKAEYYSRWVWVLSQETDKRGGQARVARMAGVREGEISQYLAIHKTFRELEHLQTSATPFKALKNQSINKLYELSKLRGSPALLEVAGELAQHLKMPIRRLRRMVKEKTEMKKLA